MNFVFLSPHFPTNFENFCVRLQQAGANVLGLADEPYSQLTWELRGALNDYYQTESMHDYDRLVRAMGFFTHKYGKIDRLDSHNEYWLETEAKLRTDFNVPGIKLDQINRMKRKSEMKKVFIEAGLSPARGKICRTREELRDFISEVGFPVVAKPDIGVGAAKTYKIENLEQTEPFWNDKLPEDYIVEEYIQGTIVTFDGLAAAPGETAFSSSLRYSKGIMETVNEDSDLYFYVTREIEPDLDAAGRKILKAFQVEERFFHFEFFKCGDELIPLEVNMRPPGGPILDMMNFANDFDCYKAWADLIVRKESNVVASKNFFVIYVSRKDRIDYHNSHQAILEKYRDLLVMESRIDGAFAQALGNQGYILRHPDLDTLLDAAAGIHKRR